MATPEELARLIDTHLGELREAQPNWCVAHSPMAGRGVFATRDIAAGEIIFRERALVVGPTARKGSALNTCVCCHQLLPVENFLCKRQCTLPVCEPCSDSPAHHNECELFQRWVPIQLSASAANGSAEKDEANKLGEDGKPVAPATPSDNTPADAAPSNSTPAAATPSDPTLLAAKPSDSTPLAATPSDTTPGTSIAATEDTNNTSTPAVTDNTKSESAPITNGAKTTKKSAIVIATATGDGKPGSVNPLALRILTALRVFFLTQDQRDLVYAMQANADLGYRREIIKAAQCFRKFPTTDRHFMDQLFRIVGVLNTNAFEAPFRAGAYETLLRGLFPLTAVMNHECTPNASHHFDNGHLAVVRAARFIPQGAEITTTYTKILWSNLTRNIFLKMTKQFACDCARCNDNTENCTYLSALFCREPECKGLVIPVQTKTLQPDWRCITCETIFPHAKMARYQDFALNAINNRINTCSVHDMIRFINEMCPRFCPPSNYVLIEAKLNVIWRMTRLKKSDEYSAEEMQHCNNYRDQILDILEKLGAGECTLKRLIIQEIE